jgi:2-dehydro-3-deoxyglucarate aldolase
VRSRLKARLAAGEPCIGSWITLGHPAIAEIMADAGFDWLAIDLEHTTIGLRETQELIRVIESAGVAPLIRLTSNDQHQAKRLLDAGAAGVIVPMINTADQARAAVAAVRYPPLGTRGVGLNRAQGYGARFEEYIRDREPETVVVAQIEHVDAVRALPEILSVPGVDATIIGPYDLSGSAGKPGQFDDPAVLGLLRDYEDRSKAAGVPMGYHVIEPDYAGVVRKLEAGYRFVGYSVDFLFLGVTCRNGMRDLRREIDRLSVSNVSSRTS